MSREDLYLLRDKKGRRYLVKTRPGGKFSYHRGTVDHDAIRRAGPGGVVHTHQGEPLLVLRPTLEDYVLLMPRAATVTYPKDAAAMVMLLDLEPGMRVLEAGTGSGGLTLFLSRAVGEGGEVVSFERRPEFQKRARANVELKNVTFVPESLEEEKVEEAGFDAVAIDLMEPWKVAPAVARALKPGRPAVFYLPNITQVVELLKAVKEKGVPLSHERTLEVHHRTWDVRPPVAHPDFRQVGFLVVLRRLREAEGVDHGDEEHPGGDEKEPAVAEGSGEGGAHEGP